MNEYAILMQKINKKGLLVFIPTKIMVGTYDRKNKIFTIDENNKYLEMTNGKLINKEIKECFGYPLNIKELKIRYNTEHEIEALENYLSDISDNIYVGVYNKDKNTIDINKISYEELENPLDKYIDHENGIYLNLGIDDINKIFEENDINVIKNMFKEHKKYIEESTLLSEKNDLKKKVNNRYSLPKNNTNTSIDALKLYKNITQKVKAQDEKIEEIITTISLNYLPGNEEKAHILLTGPSGSGKTEIMKRISEIIKVPFAMYDMTQVSMVGLQGRNIEDILLRLYEQTGGNLELAQNGILALDEIDKKASSRNEDVSGKGVLNSLLKLLDGTVFDIEIERDVFIPFNTSKLTVVAMGAFADMHRNNISPIGFGQNNNELKQKPKIVNYVQYGMPPEFMGRFNTIVNLNELSLDDLKTILLKSSISPLLLKKKILNNLNLKLKYTDGYIEAVARKAIELNTGARSLKSTIDNSLIKAMFQIISKRNYYKELIVSEKTIADNKAYILKR